MIFSRSRGSGGRHQKVDDARRARHAGDRRARDEFGSDNGERVPSATTGPYDVTAAPDGVERLDLGSMQIPAVPDVEVRVQAAPDGQVQQVVLVSGESALQLGVFAAPRTEGIWDEVREEIREQLAGDGFASEEIDGAYGTELRSQIRTPEGAMDIRFVGIDGPRWMVRAVFQGPAAADPAQAGPLAACLEGLVVDRGSEAMPVREPLPLRLPREVAQQAEQSDGTDGMAVVTDEQAPRQA
ncbi:DUF3710 domain-containing protein [Planosporangium flavigriseum]|uniref:DUF3710 domain-containing protein n=1 Tax=Planosporangium flavigriseum TaxID=373681 RepID=A0A8J3PP47_9ACTN|nr:DUF3710 domain-containing protein [Planosporangium flavigriseum]NJC63953.1 DUF3710 domain-containing protein [Planosporangium flavigriseum]GIG74666.1 hypothetical protein Pfl04_30700 [Planosporangium flavigriseum]